MPEPGRTPDGPLLPLAPAAAADAPPAPLQQHSTSQEHSPQPPPLCRHWSRTGSCLAGSVCHFAHPAGVVPVAAPRRRNWGGRRAVVRNRSKAQVLRRLLIDGFGRELLGGGSGVLDVAGGKGEISFQLLNLNGIPATVVDPRPLCLAQFERRALKGIFHRSHPAPYAPYTDVPLEQLQKEGTQPPGHARVFLDLQLVEALGQLAAARQREKNELERKKELGRKDGLDGQDGIKRESEGSRGERGEEQGRCQRQQQRCQWQQHEQGEQQKQQQQQHQHQQVHGQCQGSGCEGSTGCYRVQPDEAASCEALACLRRVRVLIASSRRRAAAIEWTKQGLREHEEDIPWVEGGGGGDGDEEEGGCAPQSKEWQQQRMSQQQEQRQQQRQQQQQQLLLQRGPWQQQEGQEEEVEGRQQQQQHQREGQEELWKQQQPEEKVVADLQQNQPHEQQQQEQQEQHGGSGGDHVINGSYIIDDDGRWLQEAWSQFEQRSGDAGLSGSGKSTAADLEAAGLEVADSKVADLKEADTNGSIGGSSSSRSSIDGGGDRYSGGSGITSKSSNSSGAGDSSGAGASSGAGDSSVGGSGGGDGSSSSSSSTDSSEHHNHHDEEDAHTSEFDALIDALLDCSCVVGLHPDAATEPAVRLALALGKPWAVVPCCVYAVQFPGRRLRDGTAVRNHGELVRYICELAEEAGRKVHVVELAFEGMNLCLWSGVGDA